MKKKHTAAMALLTIAIAAVPLDIQAKRRYNDMDRRYALRH